MKNQVSINTSKREKYVTMFTNSVGKMTDQLTKSTWNVANTALKVCTSDDFKYAFRNQADFAKATGYSPSAMSKLISTARINVEYSLYEKHGMTTGQVQELIPLFKDEDTNLLTSFIDDNISMLPTMSSKEIRALVQQHNYSLTQGDNEDSSDDSDTADSSDNLECSSSLDNQDDVIKSANEILNEIIPIVSQAHDEYNQTADLAVLRMALQSIYDILKGEELL